MVLDRFPHAHVMLAVLSCLSICHKLLVFKDLSLMAQALLQDAIVGSISLGFGKARHFRLAYSVIGRHEKRRTNKQKPMLEAKQTWRAWESLYTPCTFGVGLGVDTLCYQAHGAPRQAFKGACHFHGSLLVGLWGMKKPGSEQSRVGLSSPNRSHLHTSY
jgi:hypothetical protein